VARSTMPSPRSQHPWLRANVTNCGSAP
jgi:hypothetical protein